MPIFWIVVMIGVMVWFMRGRGSDVSQELAAMRRDIQDLKEEVRKLRVEVKGG